MSYKALEGDGYFDIYEEDWYYGPPDCYRCDDRGCSACDYKVTLEDRILEDYYEKLAETSEPL